MKAFARLAQEQEEELIKRLMETISGTKSHEAAISQKKIRDYKSQLIAINQNIKKLFEEKCSGLIPEDIYKQLMAGYSEDRKSIENEVEKLEQRLRKCCDKQEDTQKWVDLVKQHLNMQRLTRQVVVELIDHIDVCDRKKVCGKWEQRLRFTTDS